MMWSCNYFAAAAAAVVLQLLVAGRHDAVMQLLQLPVQNPTATACVGLVFVVVGVFGVVCDCPVGVADFAMIFLCCASNAAGWSLKFRMFDYLC